MTKTLFARAVLPAVAVALTATPAHAQAVGGDIGAFIQQLIDLNCRERPDPVRHPRQVLVLLDEFARLGHAGVIAHGFAYVAGYGLRLLPVLQSPAQLRGEYGPDLAEEILSNCAVEVAFAPKELRLAQELSERLGYTTVRSPSRSRPTGLSRGHRSLSESDQKRALLLPQELMQLPSDQLIVLKAGLPPVRGRKLVFHRDRALARRVRPPPPVLPCAAAPAEGPPSRAATEASVPPLTLEAIAPALAAAGLEPLPPVGAPPQAIEAWVDRFLDHSADLNLELDDHGR